MTGAQKRAQDDALYKAYALLFRLAHEREISEFKWAERPMTWVKDEASNLWTCDSPPNRAIVILKKDHWLWDVCIDMRVPAKAMYKQCATLEDAVVWAEEQLAAAVTNAEAEPAVQATPIPKVSRPAMGLGPYRIDPSTLEPGRITYQVVIELYAAPESYKTMERLCGGNLRYGERYLSPSQLAARLQIDEAECELEQPIGPNHGWNLGHSTVTYYRESVAVEQAQLLRNKSRVVEHFRKGNLLRTRYGVKEVETGYVSWLGGCESSEHPWREAPTRVEYVADVAEELTLANALDIDGFREFMGLSQDEISDERVLAALHRRRADSPAIPAERRAESRR